MKFYGTFRFLVTPDEVFSHLLDQRNLRRRQLRHQRSQRRAMGRAPSPFWCNGGSKGASWPQDEAPRRRASEREER
ncbi:hypothetical protein ERO13_D01G051476v2 [Gossypium hirsutum]|nr:hypothetical protein ERO13_D01G051476v2 [Gossypium hirsutum]